LITAIKVEVLIDFFSKKVILRQNRCEQYNLARIKQEKQNILGSREVKIISELFNITPNNYVIEYLRKLEFVFKNDSTRESGPLGRKNKQKTRGRKSLDIVPLMISNIKNLN